MPRIDQIVVIHDSVEARGGATGLARLSAIEYRKRGFDVVYITGERDDGQLSAEGVKVIGLGQDKIQKSGATRSLIRGINNVGFKALLHDWISRHDTPGTIYHLHNWAQILSPSVFTALSSVEARTVVSCHDFFNVCPNGGLLNFQTGNVCNLQPMSARCWASQCDRRSSAHKYWRMARHLNLLRSARFSSSRMTFVCLNEGMQSVMRAAGFVSPRLTQNRNPAQGYSDNRIPAENNRSFLFVGRLNKEKGADIAAKAASEASVPMVLVGEGELTSRLKSEHPDLDFAGFCNRDQIAALVRQSRALVVPGRWREPFGLVIAEAAKSGLPILISEPGTLSKDVKRFGMGQVFPANSVAALTPVLEFAASDDASIKRWSTNAFTYASEICSTTEEWINGFLDIFSDIVERS